MILEYQKKWERKRTDVNHNWLSNIYLRQLRALRKYLEINIENNENDVIQEIKLIKGNILPQWETEREVIAELVNIMEIELSPSNIFNNTPLLRIKMSREWLVYLTHSMWMNKNNINGLVEEISDIILNIDRLYKVVNHNLDDYLSDKISNDPSIVNIVSEYYDYCTKLSYKLSYCTKIKSII